MVVQTERNTKKKVLFPFISEVPPILDSQNQRNVFVKPDEQNESSL